MHFNGHVLVNDNSFKKNDVYQKSALETFISIAYYGTFVSWARENAVYNQFLYSQAFPSL